MEANSFYEKYPNLQAVLDGRVSGPATEWPKVRSELLKLVGERSRYVWAYDQLDQESQTIMRELVSALKGGSNAAEALQRYRIYQDRRKNFPLKRSIK